MTPYRFALLLRATWADPPAPSFPRDHLEVPWRGRVRAVMAEAMRCIAYPSAIHDKRPHSTGDRGRTRAMHLMREEK